MATVDGKEITAWFHCDIKPVHIGVYQTDHDNGKQDPGYCLWDGTRWGCERTSVADALRNPYFSGAVQAKDWRGLAEQPIVVAA